MTCLIHAYYYNYIDNNYNIVEFQNLQILWHLFCIEYCNGILVDDTSVWYK